MQGKFFEKLQRKLGTVNGKSLDPQDVTEALEKIRDTVGEAARIGIVLGSGLGRLARELEGGIRLTYADIPNFPVSSVEGHRGEVVAGHLSGAHVLVFSGRVHYYEGYTVQEISIPVKVMAGLGVEKMIITNAAGAVNESYSPGEVIVIKDHINLMGDNPLRGTTQFPDMTEAYSGDLRKVAHRAANGLGMELKEGVYLVMTGPSFETPAEIKMARVLGADLVGMSTIPEVIMANSLGLSVLGLSVVTNMAAGILGTPLSHKEVIETTEKTADEFERLIMEIVAQL